MGQFISVYRSWWAGELDIDSSVQRKISELISKGGKYLDACQLAEDQLGPEILDTFYLDESGNFHLSDGDVYWVLNLLKVYGNSTIINGPVYSILNDLHQLGKGEIATEKYPNFLEELERVEKLSQKIEVPRVKEYRNLLPVHPGRWLLDNGSLHSDEDPPRYSIFLEKHFVVFYPRTWRDGDIWEDSIATRMSSPFWVKEDFSYRDHETGRSFSLPWVAHYYACLEKDHLFNPKYGTFINRTTGEIDFPPHPLWMGEARIEIDSAWEVVGPTIRPFKRAYNLLEGATGILWIG